MGRGKLKRYHQNANNENVLEDGKDIFKSVKGNWRSEIFKNNNPVILELACGRAEYTTGMAQLYPDKNFVGVDIKGARLWKGSSTSNELNLKNTAFLRTYIQNIEDFFGQDEVDEIWITFPDPRPKNRDEKRRLTSHYFFKKYINILKPGGAVHLKTDSSDLFDYSLESIYGFNGRIIDATKNLYNSVHYENELTIKTTYEKKFGEKGFSINYVKFRLN